ncbi:prolipoprotein diacylglyceryl transferase [Candidatus Peregrinibacteria bacterium CG11_big_fil_rev_8_21_14_0_20_46_8]|nr:MAG: prolipoprotein diacylglyceryl transferase [Candidatus Peregrinibacteria bacterium CG11_big_fil_rev_8_21_14_0_20_46_8]
MFQSPGQVAFSLGPLTVHWYGLFIALGILVAYLYARSEFRRQQIAVHHLENLFFYMVVAGIIGARIYYVLFSLDFFLAQPLEIVQIWHGGLAIHGALIGGGLALLAYTRKHHLHLIRLLDAFLPGVLLAQAFGRWGNFFNSEAFGEPTNLPWKLFIPLENRPLGYEEFDFFHPTFLYESLWNFIGFGVLAYIARHTKRPGLVSCGYLMWYSFGRFFIEGLRLDSLYLGSIRIAQLVSALLFVAGLVGLRFVMQRGKIKDN